MKLTENLWTEYSSVSSIHWDCVRSQGAFLNSQNKTDGGYFQKIQSRLKKKGYDKLLQFNNVNIFFF